MIPIVLFKKFMSLQCIASVEVSNMARCSSKTNALRDIDSIGCIDLYFSTLLASKYARKITPISLVFLISTNFKAQSSNI